METSNKLIGEQLSLWTSSAADIPVNHSAQQESEKEQMTQDTFGHGSEQPLASYDPDTQSWRMSEDISLWGEFKLLENLPKSGMTRSGVLYPQPAWVRPIDANESSLWPTPTTQEVEHPTAIWNNQGRRVSKNGKPSSHGMGLADAVKMWPTPVSSSSMAEDISTVQERLKNGKPYKSRLIEAVAMWPTPTTVDTFTPKSRSNPTLGDAARKSEDSNGKLNPTWVEWLMGFPIGWTDLKD